MEVVGQILSPLILFTDSLVVLACLTGDLLLQEPDITRNSFVKALTDSCTHGLVGLLSWIVVAGVSCRTQTIKEFLLCGFFAIIIDIDHFVAAKSLRLKDATSLVHRPPLHSTTVIPVIILLEYLVSFVVTLPCQESLPWILLVSLTSHHLRDANRRGLWFWPLGATPPLPRVLYISLVVTLPLVVRLIRLLSQSKPALTLASIDV